MNKDFYIFKLGTTYPEHLERIGDFDHWITQSISFDLPFKVIEVCDSDPLPDFDECQGVIITGSHAMVTDAQAWSENLETWMTDALKKNVPMLGICYGHQLLAKAGGGLVDYHPDGVEVGSLSIYLQENAHSDALFQFLPNQFLGNVSHSQSVRVLPENAVLLASSDHEPVQAFRIGDHAWGVQFHPEFEQELMEQYIIGQEERISKSDLNFDDIYFQAQDTPESKGILNSFISYVQNQNPSNYQSLN